LFAWTRLRGRPRHTLVEPGDERIWSTPIKNGFRVAWQRLAQLGAESSEMPRPSWNEIRNRLHPGSLRVREFVDSHRTGLIALFAFGLSAYLASSFFLPNLDGIGGWDEAAYVDSGRTLVAGTWPSVAANPLVGVLYALTYLPFSRSDFWLIHSTSLGRVVLFVLIWLSVYAVATQLARWTHPLTLVGLLFVSSIPLALIKFPSDALFVAMAAFSFWKLLSFYNNLRLTDLAWSSLFLGLAALARNDGLVMGPILVVLAVVVSAGRTQVWKAVLTAAIPFVVVVGGYLLVHGWFSGDYRLGTQERAYDNFEAGQETVFSVTGIDPTLEAKLEARRLFGTPEENNNSILRAVLRNPRAYLDRLAALIRNLPEFLLSAYGLRLAAILFLLALRGAWELWRQRERRLLVVFLLWPAHLASGVAITFFRVGHVQFPFYALYGLSAIGLTALIANRASSRERIVWTAVLLAMAGWSVALQAPAVQFGVVCFGAGLVLTFWIWPTGNGMSNARVAPALGLVFIGIGLLLHGDFPGPKTRTLGERPDEQAVVFMEHSFERGTRVAAGAPGPVAAARMTYMGLTSLDVPVGLAPSEFVGWLRDQGIEAVYVDYSLSAGNPAVWEMVSASIGQGLDRVFAAGEGDFQVLAVRK
jgi:hypothetical protein